MKDFPTAGDGRPEIVRRMRDLYRALKDRGRHVLLVSPRLAIPEDAKKEIYVVEYELPDDGEIARILERAPAAPPRARRSSEPRDAAPRARACGA